MIERTKIRIVLLISKSFYSKEGFQVDNDEMKPSVIQGWYGLRKRKQIDNDEMNYLSLLNYFTFLSDAKLYDSAA